MELNKSFLAGFLCALSLFGCASMSYQYYGLSEVNFDKGILLGPEPKFDLPFTACAPSPDKKFPCVVVMADQFFKMKQELKDLEMRLDQCERDAYSWI